MNKAALRNQVVSKTGLGKKSVRNVLNASTKMVCDAFPSGERVALGGLGTFQIVNRKVRVGRNPQTGGTIQIPLRRCLSSCLGRV